MNQKTKQKTLGLALGGGGVRGLAHIGTLDILQKSGIRIDSIAGTSMGAVIGAVCALGISMDDFMHMLIKYTPKKLLTLKTLNLSNDSLLKPNDFERMLKGLFQEKTFADCKIPFVCTAVDLESGKLVTIKTGLLWEAVRASSSLPLILPPMFMDERLLVDGGVIDNLPMPELAAMGSEIKVGIGVNSTKGKQSMSADIYKRYYKKEKKGIFKLRERIRDRAHFMLDVMIRTLEIAMEDSMKLRVKSAKPDMLIESVVPVGLIELDKAAEAIAIGRKAMRENLPALKKLLTE